jgi:iron complex transport system substrate-binding protein
MTTVLNVTGLVLALVLAVVATVVPNARGQAPVNQVVATSDLKYQTLPNGKRGLVDFAGRVVEIADYQRIASGSLISDALLLEFVSPERIASFTNFSDRSELLSHRYLGKPRFDPLGDLESLLELRPDLLLVSTISSASKLERLRDVGLNVFSLGEMRGVESFMLNTRYLAAIVGREDLGRRYERAFMRRMRSIAQTLPMEGRKTAAYMIFYGGKIFGSGTGTSFHDVMSYAGLIDLGAKQYAGWPAWSPEQVLSLDPDVIVTRTGLGYQVCSNPALKALRACAAGGKIAEVPEELLNDPGPGMLPTAEEIFEQVYGSR